MKKEGLNKMLKTSESLTEKQAINNLKIINIGQLKQETDLGFALLIFIKAMSREDVREKFQGLLARFILTEMSDIFGPGREGKTIH